LLADARVNFDAYPDLELPARVSCIGSMATGSGRRAYYVGEVPVYLELQGTDPRVIPSLSASADVILERNENTTIVPREAIFKDQPDGDACAFVEGASGWEKRDLVLGLANHTSVAVLSGLDGGETVATEAPPGGGCN